MSDFINTLMEMRGGEVAMDCNRKLHELISAVLEAGKGGELALRVKVAPSKFGMGGAVLEVQVEHDCKVKKPELSLGKSLFFVSQDGTLTRDDPRQIALYGEEAKVG